MSLDSFENVLKIKYEVILKMKGIRSFVIIMVLVTMAIVSFAYYFSNNYKEIYLAELDRDLTENNIENSDFIESQIKNILVLVKSHSNVFPSNDLISTSDLADVFELVNKEFDYVNSMYFIYDSDGNAVNSSGEINVTDLDEDLRQRPWYLDAVMSRNKSITGVYKDVNDDKPVITVSYAVRKGTQLQGVLAADMFLETIYDQLQEITTWKNAYSYILDQNGTIVLYPDENILGFSFEDITETQLEELGISKDYFIDNYSRIWNDFISKSTDGSVEYSNLNNSEVHAVFEQIPNLNWTIVSAYEYSEVAKAFSKYDLIGALISVLVIMISGATLYYFLVWSESRDPITRTFTTKKMSEMIQKRLRGRGACVLLFIDLRKLSLINDRYGIRGGDKILLQFTKTIRKLVRKKGVLATTKSRNFIFTFNDNDWNNAVEFTLNLGKQLEKLQLIINDNALLVESFMVLTELGVDDVTEFEKELEYAEKLLANLKKTELESPLICHEFNKLMEDNKAEIKLKDELLKAIEEDRIIPFFQPIYNMKSGTIDKFEVLMRIQEEDKFLLPYPYILIAEKYNIIDKVDSIVISKALEYKKSSDLNDEVELSINISGKVLENGKFMEKVVEKVDQLNLKYSNITFEITETINIGEIAKLVELVREYRKAGFKFSIDDFGTGFSSMYYLKHIPANYLKIDGSFINDIDNNKESYHVVKSIINMAKAFNIKTVAEFVEKEEIMDMLKEMGIDFGQGYFFGKPEESFNFHRELVE
jgi:diguanylate cyclase (GGDEF)-like protein